MLLGVAHTNGTTDVMKSLLATAAAVACTAVALDASAHEAGDVTQADNIGIPLYTHNFTTGKDITIADKLLVSEFMGAHYWLTDRLRIGMMFQLTEQFAGDLAPGSDHFQVFALLPQIGYNFYDHFQAAAIFTYAPRAGGKDQMDLGFQALVGYSFAIRQGASFGAAVEIPVNLKLATTIGATPILGFSYDL
jgi:hypothetical protein